MRQKMRMMMSKTNPWNDIKTPVEDLSVRQIKISRHLPLYWGKDSSGHCVFIYEMSEDGAEIFQKNMVSIHGIKIDYRLLSTTGNQGLILVLEKHVDQDLFYSLCETLIHELSEVSDPLVGLSVALSQIKRWKAFMAGKKGQVLSAEEVRGLFSELKFLLQMLGEMNNELDALEAWQGPETSHQDFIFSDTAVEVKSLSGRERNAVKISSEDQLESLSSSLFLKVFRLVDMPESKASISLNELVNAVEEMLTEAEAIEMFDTKLAKAGYVQMLAYDKPKFIVAEEQTYRVERDFPKIIRSELHTGLTRVGYEIKLESVRNFLCADKDVWGG
ncbi:PD-(D/E)XK motif protein [Pseudoalteromonas piscicida]|uniref:PD-(D/E)XK motif protein n=1 Tax=Pseudoalteromonas piscicida TaxID=43662 RepID=UPI001D09DCF6|nr:PD-(D/E)XK motif protein [Pseudoalteromonas piscicida]UDM62728.1 PD-(D/E)XK motif protein [Pseudoalteromonas piscicida]